MTRKALRGCGSKNRHEMTGSLIVYELYPAGHESGFELCPVIDSQYELREVHDSFRADSAARSYSERLLNQS
jgi:hypothetical protein